MGKTKIEYLDYTWNQIAMRCDRVSPGCANCWHLKMAARLTKNPTLPVMTRQAYDGGFPVLTHRLKDPLKIKKPSRIGVQFMGDLFHEAITDEMIREVFWVMQRCGQHTFFILTKRPIRLQKFIDGALIHPHIWLGVTVCNQWEIDHQFPGFIQIHSFKKWVSLEPLLGPVNIKPFLFYLKWVVAGAEQVPSPHGNKGRPADNDWFRSIRDQCRAAGVPFFMKKTTGPIPDDLMIREFPKEEGK